MLLSKDKFFMLAYEFNYNNTENVYYDIYNQSLQ